MFEHSPPSSPFEHLEQAIHRWRGIPHWPETEATVFSCSWIADVESGGGWYNVIFSYPSEQGIQSGEFKMNAPETTSPFFPRDTFLIRYNPRKPRQFYATQRRRRTSSVIFLLGFTALGVAGVLVWCLVR